MAISDAGFWNQAAAIEGRAGLTNAMANEKAKLQARVMLSGIARVASHEWDKRNLRVVPFARGTSSALSDPPDAIVLDIDASSDAEQADCFQLHDLLHVPMIVVTSDPSSARAVDLLARGVDDVVAHPAGPALLAASVSAVLRRNRRDSGGGIPKLLNLDSVQIDLVERQVRHGGVCHSLSRIEYRLLVALLRAEGRACSHRELIQQVWGPGYDSATHYLRL